MDSAIGAKVAVIDPAIRAPHSAATGVCSLRNENLIMKALSHFSDVGRLLSIAGNC
jgi:hypothetical protein